MQKYIVYLLYKLETSVSYGAAALAVLLFGGLILRSTTWTEQLYYSVVDNSPGRGAAIVSSDVFGDSYQKVVYLKQNWSEADSLWFYNTTQGSDLLPYSFFLHLEQPASTQPFRAPENINRYRYLPQVASSANPDGLPVGFVADTYLGRKFMGFTCAACHTAQVNYKGTGIRIDGGPGAADMDTFMRDLEAAIAATRTDPAKHQRFVSAVVKSGEYRDAAEIDNDLAKYGLRLEAYNFFNESKDKDGPVPYGYARLDAFGRIYNRVLEHVANPEALRIVLATALPVEETRRLLDRAKPVLTSEDRDHIMERLSGLLTVDERRKLRDMIFNSPNAPASYPFLWDIPQHDYVQWNGIGANAGVGPIGRNAGEVIGVFGTLDWAKRDGWSFYAFLGGQGLGPTYIDFKSSVNVHNLRQLEDRLSHLQSPLWADAAAAGVLPPLDDTRILKGEVLFDKFCAACHAVIERDSPTRRVVAHMDKLSAVKTDPGMASNAVEYNGYSGIIRNQYSNTSVGSVLLDTRAPVAAILTKATENVVATPDPDKWWFTRTADWAVDLIREFFKNEIKPSVKAGDYSPDTTVIPFDSLRAYKGRSLNGIWATAPYLHNGSVPTLYDLLLPATRRDGDPADTKYRPAKFRVGSRELDVDHVGFRHGENDYDGFLFDTSKRANSNSGHEYGTRQLSEEDRLDLVEYLKSL